MAQHGKRRQHSSEFKARVALAAAAEGKTLAELAAEFDRHPTVISAWKSELVGNAAPLFGKEKRWAEVHQKTVDALYREIGRLKVENDLLASLCAERAERSGQKRSGAIIQTCRSHASVPSWKCLVRASMHRQHHACGRETRLSW